MKRRSASRSMYFALKSFRRWWWWLKLWRKQFWINISCNFPVDFWILPTHRIFFLRIPILSEKRNRYFPLHANFRISHALLIGYFSIFNFFHLFSVPLLDVLSITSKRLFSCSISISHAGWRISALWIFSFPCKQIRRQFHWNSNWGKWH